ncbi:MAG: hypothetical protein OEY78_00445 [Gammaproteobacteria bacterium]|nr:hypothetical protein [Gammaproteobacteria bacterium]
MKTKFFLLLLFIGLFSHNLVAFAYYIEKPEQIIRKEHQDPFKILEIFFHAVKQGELIVLGKKIEKALLVPIQVEYIYKFDGSKPSVKVYSELKYPLAIPEHKGIRLMGVSAILNNNGDIIEIRAHVVPDN